MSKTLTEQQIRDAAIQNGITYESLRAVIDVEVGNRSGFDDDGNPTILFEPHVLWRELGKVFYITKRKQLADLFPDMCNPTWDKSLYNVRPQHQKLYVASVLHWEAAHKSCSWGIGQVMGFNAASLGYPSLKQFVDDMHESEAKQLEAMIRFITVNNLKSALIRNDWSAFAEGYNGKGYRENKYDEKLADAHAKWSRA